jgi:hypothetical protein
MGRRLKMTRHGDIISYDNADAAIPENHEHVFIGHIIPHEKGKNFGMVQI